MSSLLDILTGRAMLPSKSDIRFPLCRRFRNGERLLVAIFTAPSGVTLLVAKTTKEGFTVEVPGKFFSAADDFAKIRTIRDFSKSHGVHYAVAGITEANIALKVGKVEDITASSWTPKRGFDVRVFWAEYSQYVSFEVSHETVSRYEKIMDDAQMTLVRIQNIFASALRAFVDIETRIFESNHVVVSLPNAAFVLGTGQAAEWVTATGRTEEGLDLIAWLRRNQSDERFAEHLDKPVVLASVNLDEDSEKVKSAFGGEVASRYAEDFLVDALTDDSKDSVAADLQSNSEDTRQVLSGWLVFLVWISIVLTIVGIVAGGYSYLEIEATKLPRAAAQKAKSEADAAREGKTKEIEAIRAQIHLAIWQADWAGQTTRLQPVVNAIVTSLGVTKLTKASIAFNEGGKQMIVDLDAVGEAGAIAKQFQTIITELGSLGYRVASTDQPRQPTGMRFRGTFLFSPTSTTNNEK